MALTKEEIEEREDILRKKSYFKDWNKLEKQRFEILEKKIKKGK